MSHKEAPDVPLIEMDIRITIGDQVHGIRRSATEAQVERLGIDETMRRMFEGITPPVVEKVREALPDHDKTQPPDHAYFCGVRPGTKAGHYCEPSDGPSSPWGESSLGYRLLDWHPERDGRRTPRGDRMRRIVSGEPEGEFAHLIEDGWTLIAAWDRSADRRGGCSASFAFGGEYTPQRALTMARDRWPLVFARIEAHIGRTVTVRPAEPAVPYTY